MRNETPNRDTGVLSQFTGTYLKARWYLGAGLVVLTAINLLFGLSSRWVWVLGAAGLVVLAHALAMHLMVMTSVIFALVVDVTATHLGVLVFSTATDDEIGPSLMVATAAVIIGMFSDGWARNALIIYSTTFALLTLIIVGDWDLLGVADQIIAVIFVVGLVSGVISAVRRRLIELEVVRAQTLGIVSHELRNHLTGVIGATELMMDEEAGLGPDDVNDLIVLSHEQAVEASEVIEDLLIASRAERGVLDAVPEPVDLVPLTQVVIRRSSIAESDIALSSPDRPVWAMADPLRYKQIVRNLLTNAINYGGPTIRVSVESTENAVTVTVTDDGEGVVPSAVSGLFQPYHRVKDAQAPGSTGLGLWIARGLAHKMGGNLTYRRETGLTAFELTLPAASAPDPATEQSRSSHAAGQLTRS